MEHMRSGTFCNSSSSEIGYLYVCRTQRGVEIHDRGRYNIEDRLCDVQMFQSGASSNSAPEILYTMSLSGETSQLERIMSTNEVQEFLDRLRLLRQ